MTGALIPFSPRQSPALTADGVRDRLEAALLRVWAALESPHSRRNYRREWETWCAWLQRSGVHPLNAAPLHVQRYLEELYNAGKAKGTRMVVLAVLRSVYGALVVSFSDADIIATNPAREVKNIKVSKDPKTPWLSETELRAMLAQRGDTWQEQRDWLILAMLVGTGLRRSEVAGMRLDQLMPGPSGGLVAKVKAKGGKDGIIGVPRWVADEIAKWRPRLASLPPGINGNLFPVRVGAPRPLSVSKLRNVITALAVAAGVDPARATPHAIRRSFVTLTGERGASLADRQAALLHSSSTTTERYDHASRIAANPPGQLLADLAEPRKP